MIQHSVSLLRVALVSLLLMSAAGCEQLNLEPPRSNIERAAYIETGAQAAIKTLMSLTCEKYQPSGECETAGRPLHPERSKGYLEQLSRVRTAVRAFNVMTMGKAAVGQCLGQPATPTACLDLAGSMLREVERVLGDIQKRGT